MNEVLLVAAQRDMIDETVQAVERSGLKLTAIDVTPFAVVRGIFGVSRSVLPDDTEAAGEATAVIHMSAGITNIVVVENGVPRFTRVSSLAANEMTRAVATALDITLDEADDLKQRVGLPGVDETGIGADIPSDIDPERVRGVQEALERQVSKFMAEVRRSLDYYLTQTSQVRAIRRILLTGSGAKLRNFDSYIARGLQAEVELADAMRWVSVPSQYQALLQADRLGATAAIGLAMGSVVA
jgi:type IV pilus assembly protein PilM